MAAMTALEHVPVVEIVVNTPLDEAKAAAAQIRSGLESVFEGLTRMVAVQGWKLLGYPSFRQWAREELAWSLGKADLHLRKAKTLMELSKQMNRTIAELEPTIALRMGHRGPMSNPLVKHMKTATTALSKIPALTTPDERIQATALRDALTRLLGE